MTLRFRIESLEAVGSTNDVVKRALEAGEPEGLVVRARRQTGGYGRQGRSWASPEGGMYLSLLLRPNVPPAQLPTLSLVAGLAVRRAIASLVTSEEGRRVKVKWPNDVVYVPDATGSLDAAACFGEGGGRSPECAELGGAGEGAGLPDQAGDAPLPACGERGGAPSDRPSPDGAPSPRAAAPCAAGSAPSQTPVARRPLLKLCGISTEAHAGGVCVGIGVNVMPPAHPAAVAGKNVPAYLSDLGFGFTCEERAAVDEVAAAVLREMASLYGPWTREGLAPLADEYDAHAALAGRALSVADRNGAVLAEGVAVGIDGHGRLLLRRPDGALVPVASGEAHIR